MSDRESFDTVVKVFSACDDGVTSEVEWVTPAGTKISGTVLSRFKESNRQTLLSKFGIKLRTNQSVDLQNFVGKEFLVTCYRMGSGSRWFVAPETLVDREKLEKYRPSNNTNQQAPSKTTTHTPNSSSSSMATAASKGYDTRSAKTLRDACNHFISREGNLSKAPGLFRQVESLIVGLQRTYNISE